MIVLVIVIGIVAIILIAKGVRIVPQAENWIVERFGKYVETLQPGLNLINPIFSKIAKRLDIREVVLDLPSQSIITSDNASLQVNGIVFYKIMDPYKSYYGINDLEMAITALAQTTLRAIMGKMMLDETLSKRDKINNELLVVLDEASDAWGTKITRVEIQDIEPPEDIKEAMTQQMKAERAKRAQILEAEGSRQAAIEKAEGLKKATVLKAEAEKEAAELEAAARERKAKAEARALQMVAESLLASGGDPAIYLMGQEYIKNLMNVASSNNSKTVILPADILQTVRMLFKSKVSK